MRNLVLNFSNRKYKYKNFLEFLTTKLLVHFCDFNVILTTNSNAYKKNCKFLIFYIY